MWPAGFVFETLALQYNLSFCITNGLLCKTSKFEVFSNFKHDQIDFTSLQTSEF
jgi:hypothetical protein